MKYDVPVYREMRLLFEGIEAESPEAAAEIARRKHLPEAVEVDDCEGRNFAAQVVEPERCDEPVRPTMVNFADRLSPRPGRGTGPGERGR